MREQKSAQLVEDIGNGMSRVTGTCRVCERVQTVNAPTIGLLNWWFGEFIESALPDMAYADHEFLANQICKSCDPVWQEATA